jgi:hypothetical protein
MKIKVFMTEAEVEDALRAYLKKTIPELDDYSITWEAHGIGINVEIEEMEA